MEIMSTIKPVSRLSSNSTNPPAVGAHILAGVYYTLTRIPGEHRVSAEQAKLFIGNISERLAIIALSGDENAYALGASAAVAIVDLGAMRARVIKRPRIP
jgi:hypothetical protein